MKPNKLHDKYFKGKSTLEEEKQLRKQSDDLLLKALDSYEKPNLSSIENKISSSIKTKNNYRKIMTTVGTAAALLIALLSIPMYDHYQNKIAERKVETIFTSQEYIQAIKMSHQMISKLTQAPKFIELENEQISSSTFNIKFSMPTLSRLEFKN